MCWPWALRLGSWRRRERSAFWAEACLTAPPATACFFGIKRWQYWAAATEPPLLPGACPGCAVRFMSSFEEKPCAQRSGNRRLWPRLRTWCCIPARKSRSSGAGTVWRLWGWKSGHWPDSGNRPGPRTGAIGSSRIYFGGRDHPNQSARCFCGRRHPVQAPAPDCHGCCRRRRGRASGRPVSGATLRIRTPLKNEAGCRCNRPRSIFSLFRPIFAGIWFPTG